MRSDSTFEVSKEYRTALKNFWQGRNHTALENLTNALGSETDHINRFNLYRLWIEILADQQNYLALDQLQSHLLFRSAAAPSDAPHYAALRGLIHLERDEVKLAKFYLESVQNAPRNDYAVELSIRLDFRFSESVDFPRKVSLIDYCSIKNVATVFWHEEHLKGLKNQETVLKKNYADSPLIPVLKMHEAFMNEDYEGAFQASKQLYLAYPSHTDYLVMNAWSAMKTERYSEAEVVLENFVQQSSDEDVDVLTLLSSLYQKLYETTQDKKYKQESIRYSKKSQSWLENNSMDSTMERFHSRMLETESTRQRDHSTRAVLLCVNARNIFEMSELSESEFKNFKLTSSSPLNSGDVVFLCSKSRHGQKEWRLTAAAKITGEANWIPANSYEHSAQGLCRPSYSPTLTLNFDPSILVENSPIELSGDALDYIVDSVREQIDQEEISQDFSQTLTLLSA